MPKQKLKIISAVELDIDSLPEHCFVKTDEEGLSSLFYDDGKTKGQIVLEASWLLEESDDEGKFFDRTPLNKKVQGLEIRLNARVDEYHNFGNLIMH